MEIALTYHDFGNLPNRVDTIRRACMATGVNFIVAKRDSFVPSKMLPVPDGVKNLNWWRCHLIYLVNLGSYRPDFHWSVEWDVQGTQETWERLLSSNMDKKEDLLTSHLYHRSEATNNKWFSDPSTMPNHDWYFSPSVYRLSAQAIDWLLGSAEKNREEFVDVCVPSVVAEMGGTTGTLNTPGVEPVAHPCTIKFSPTLPGLHPRRLRHPVKRDEPALC